MINRKHILLLLVCAVVLGAGCTDMGGDGADNGTGSDRTPSESEDLESEQNDSRDGSDSPFGSSDESNTSNEDDSGSSAATSQSNEDDSDESSRDSDTESSGESASDTETLDASDEDTETSDESNSDTETSDGGDGGIESSDENDEDTNTEQDYYSVTVTVVDADGEPMEGVDVTATHDDSGGERTLTTDAEGTVIFSVTNGKFTISSTPADGGEITESVTVNGDASVTLESDVSGDDEQDQEEENNGDGDSGGGDDSGGDNGDEPSPSPDYNCEEDFTNWNDAKEIYDENPDDIYGLDGDDDGIPCEDLPGAPEDRDGETGPEPPENGNNQSNTERPDDDNETGVSDGEDDVVNDTDGNETANPDPVNDTVDSGTDSVDNSTGNNTQSD